MTTLIFNGARELLKSIATAIAQIFSLSPENTYLIILILISIIITVKFLIKILPQNRDNLASRIIIGGIVYYSIAYL